MKKEQRRYRAATLLWHSVENRYIEPGEEITLYHLAKEQVDKLLRMNAIVPVEVKDGTDDQCDEPEKLQG